ncbi:MAG: hypothetical protein ABIK09_06215 [Pseudomonadota bacterium]
MADRLLAGLDNERSPAPVPEATLRRDRRVRELRTLLARVQTRRRPVEDPTP